MKRFRSIAEITIGVLSAIGAIDQLAFVLRDSEAFYEAMAAASWISPATALIEEVLLPRSALVTIAVGVLEAGLAIAILLGLAPQALVDLIHQALRLHDLLHHRPQSLNLLRTQRPEILCQ